MAFKIVMESFLEHQPIYGFADVPFTIQGYSRAARLTGFWIPELAILLDAGIRTDVTPKAILITHTHTDHAGELGQICMNKSIEFPVFAHPKATQPLRNYLTAIANLRGCSTQITWNPVLFKATILALHPDEGFVPISTIRNWFVKSVFLRHTIPNVGFVLGQKIQDTIKPWLAYLCDGTTVSISNALDNMDVMPAIVMVECTFINDQAQADSCKHANWQELKTIVAKYANVQFVLFHFSTRITTLTLREWSRSLPANVKVVL